MLKILLVILQHPLGLQDKLIRKVFLKGQKIVNKRLKV